MQHVRCRVVHLDVQYPRPKKREGTRLYNPNPHILETLNPNPQILETLNP